VQSIGAVTLDPKNSRVVWVGTGESWTRNSVSIGNGIYKSTDNGDTWQRMGLPNSERIAQIIVSPENSDIVYVAVPGALVERLAGSRALQDDRWRAHVAAHPEGRQSLDGLLDDLDGSEQSERDPRGHVGLPAQRLDVPLRRRRSGCAFREWSLPTADGGATWTEVTPENAKGFPTKPYGRLAVNHAPSIRKRVYCFVEGKDSALFVSDDGGASWDKRDKSTWMVWRPFYFARMTVDPKNRSRLQGQRRAHHERRCRARASRTSAASTARMAICTRFGSTRRIPDRHRRRRRRHLVFLQRRHEWWKGDNLPISQFYHVSVDDADPYRVYGGLQDNSSWVGDSQYPGGITNSRWENLYGGDGFWVFPDPADPDYVYAEYQGGVIARINRKTLQGRQIQPKPNYKEKLRWNWNTPIALSPTEKGTIYVGAQFLFRSRNQGQSWDRISPDLTTNDSAKQQQEKSGGITGRQFRGRDAHHDLLDLGVAEGQERDLGWHR
jgi:hypothetical protein